MEVGEKIFATFLENKILSQDKLELIKEKVGNYWGNHLHYFSLLKGEDRFDDVLNVLKNHWSITQDDIDELERQLEEENQCFLEDKKEEKDSDYNDITIQEEKTENKRRDIPEEIFIKKFLEEKKKSKIFSKEQIDLMIRNKDNLYEKIKWYQIPKDNAIYYTTIQLYRFIDSWGADLKIKPEKLDWKICSIILNKINWAHEIQDVTNFYRRNNTTQENENIFFEGVIKYIGSTLAKINPDSSHVMQDGSFSLEYKWKEHDFRLNSMPWRCWGSSYCGYTIRLTSEWNAINFDSIELLPFAKKQLTKMIENKIGWLNLFTGPTWSWKSTTIYAMLNKVDKIKYWVISVEKPIESQIFWVLQTQEDTEIIREDKNAYTMFHAIKWCLRQSPDLIFLWELRTKEEIHEGVKAALVWNKVISTMHTNSAVDTLLREKEEWLTNNVIWNANKFIVAQRLVSKLCPHCSIEDKNSSEHIDDIKRYFERWKLFFQKNISNLLDDMDIDDIKNIDNLLLSIEWEIQSISKEDFILCKNLLILNFEKIKKLKTKSEIKKFILGLVKNFPYPEDREYIENEIKNWKIKLANTNWCQFCKEWYKGRIMVLEILEIEKSIKRFIQDDSMKLIDLEKYLLDKWFINMEIYWKILALRGQTTIEKVEELID